MWNPGKGRLQAQRVGAVQAARVDLRTLSNEAKVGCCKLVLASAQHVWSRSLTS